MGYPFLTPQKALQLVLSQLCNLIPFKRLTLDNTQTSKGIRSVVRHRPTLKKKNGFWENTTMSDEAMCYFSPIRILSFLCVGPLLNATKLWVFFRESTVKQNNSLKLSIQNIAQYTISTESQQRKRRSFVFNNRTVRVDWLFVCRSIWNIWYYLYLCRR